MWPFLSRREECLGYGGGICLAAYDCRIGSVGFSLNASLAGMGRDRPLPSADRRSPEVKQKSEWLAEPPAKQSAALPNALLIVPCGTVCNRPGREIPQGATNAVSGRPRTCRLALMACSEAAQATGTLGCRMIGTGGNGRLKMKRIISALTSRKWALVAAAALSLTFDCAFGQTTRTSPSVSSTSKTIPSSSSTSPNSPCSSNPSSPCYSANAPRNPCYSAVAPNEPCSNTITPNSQTSSAPPPPAATTPQATVRAFTQDQAKSQIEAKGYSNVSGLRKDAKGIWRGKAVKDGLPASVTLDADGNVAAQ
jgi:hypothetical protein